MLGQYEEALSHYNYGIARYSENWEIFFHRGLAYVSLTNFEKTWKPGAQTLAFLEP